MDDTILTNRILTTYLGEGRVEIEAGSRRFITDQRICLDRPGASFCPLELIAAALGA